jgi:hypothetical protein
MVHKFQSMINGGWCWLAIEETWTIFFVTWSLTNKYMFNLSFNKVHKSYILIALSVCDVTILAFHSMAEPASVNGAAQG